jgi:hypothetical protein
LIGGEMSVGWLRAWLCLMHVCEDFYLLVREIKREEILASDARVFEVLYDISQICFVPFFLAFWQAGGEDMSFDHILPTSYIYPGFP